MALSYYASTRPGALSVAMNSSTTQVALVSAATFPDPAGPGNGQYTIIVGYGSDREEVCTVTAKSGDTLTVIRGQDSSAATAKNQGDVVVHGVSARDFKGFAQTTDPRFTDARTPTAHAASHATGGTDVITAASIGAASAALGSFVICRMTSDYNMPGGPPVSPGKYYAPMTYAYKQQGTDAVYNGGGIAVNTAGSYLLGATVGTYNGTAIMSVSVHVVGSADTFLYLGGQQPVDATSLTMGGGSTPWQCSAGDRITLILSQATGIVGFATTSLWAARIG